MSAVAVQRRPRRLAGLGWRGLAVAAVVVTLAWALVPVALLVYHVIRNGGVVSGSDGALPGADQLFYMDSIRQSGEHFLIGDNFALALGHRVFLDPLFLIGGLIWRLGVPLQAAFWALKLIAAPMLAIGALAVAAEALEATRARAVAVALAVFSFSPVAAVLSWTHVLSPLTRFELLLPAGESSPAWQLWGYPQAGVAVGALALGLLGAVRLTARAQQPADAGGRAIRARQTADAGLPVRLIAGVSAAGCIAAWLHPWQGATFLMVVAVLALSARSRRVAIVLALPAVAAALPLVYELILSHADAAWKVDSAQNAVGHDPVWMVLVAVLPLALPALAGVRELKASPLRTALVAWPVCALAVYFFTSQFAYHALQGITIPLAVLAVGGWPRLVRLAQPLTATWLTTALVLIAIVPGAAYQLKTFRDSERSGAAPYTLGTDDHDALVYLDRAGGAGGVLARDEIGMAVPAFTGRRTWVGEWTWTPDFARRVALAGRLMSGQMSPTEARRFVRSTGAGFVLADCGTSDKLQMLIAPLISSWVRYGCASVYQLR